MRFENKDASLQKKQQNTKRLDSKRKPEKIKRHEMFNSRNIPKDAKSVLEKFDDIVAETRGLSAKQRVFLSSSIKKLSHSLTDDRGSRRVGYMNSAENVTAYISYFQWWNLVRLTRLFSNMPKNAFPLSEKSVAIDIGSGPLTVVTALWLARPELRTKKITWYCLDLSQNALAQGEEIYLSVAAKTISMMNEGEGSAVEPWKIIRVKGELGTSIKEKAELVTCANAFNEMIQMSDMPTDFLAKKYSDEIEKYMAESASVKSVLLVEPGDPHSARFISLLRSAFIRRDFLPVAPCPHADECPMAGRTGGKTTTKNGKSAKWCNFSFSTEDAPSRLLKLSEKANLSKERASLSFVLLQKNAESEKKTENENAVKKDDKLALRIASNFIKLPDIHKSGYYACSRLGLVLAVDMANVQPKNGELLEIPFPEKKLERDQKSGALRIDL